MTVPALFDQAALELAIGGSQYLVRFTDDDGDGVADAAVVASIIDGASALAVGLLAPGFPTGDQVATLVISDAAVLDAITDIAVGIAGGRRPEFTTPEGKPLFLWRRQQGEKTLARMGSAQQRVAGEEVAGANSSIGSRVARSDRGHMFPRSSADGKGGGGF